MNNNRIYIAGKVTGDLGYKAKFKAAEAELKDARRWCGNEFHNKCRQCVFYDRNWTTACRISDVFPQQVKVVNPTTFNLDSRPYWVAMLVCLWNLRRCKYVYMLRDWKSSRGARIEHRFAKFRHKMIIYQRECAVSQQI